MTQPETVYKALGIAAQRIGDNNYRTQLEKHLTSRRKSTFKFLVTPAHREIINAMSDVLGGKVTPGEAMSLLHRHDTETQLYGLDRPMDP